MEVNDYLNLEDNYIIRIKLGDEKIYFSDKIKKKRFGLFSYFQERNILITNIAVYNLEGIELKSRKKISDLYGITYSEQSNQFIIHYDKNDYDYLYESEKRDTIILLLQNLYVKLEKKDLLFSVKNEKDLSKYVVDKKERKKNPHLVKLDKNELTSIHKFFKKESEPEDNNEKINKSLEKLIWLDPNVNNRENLFYQIILLNSRKFELFTFTETKDCIEKLKAIEFIKTYIIINHSKLREFFIEFEKIINSIKICPEIIIFTSQNKLNLIMKNIYNLDKFSLFNNNLIFNDFEKVLNKLISEDKYIPNYIPENDYDPNDNSFSYEYINKLNDLILPLTFIDFMEFPSKTDIIEFNQFFLDKYSENSEKMKNLIEQLLIDVNIPLQILVKYWIRAYTLESLFYYELNYALIKYTKNDYDIFLRILYQGLINKAIIPFIDQTLYRGSRIKKDELKYIQEALSNKKEDLPGCICYNKAFLSSSQDKNIALSFLKIPMPHEESVLYIFEKGEDLDKENATNAEIQEFSAIKGEKEILFFPYSCFEILKVEENKLGEKKYFEIYLSYLGKYKNKINKNEKIPENNFAKNLLSTNILDKNEINKEENQKKFDFKIDKYISSEIKTSFILAIYNITENDLYKKIQILNCDEKINLNELKNICKISLDNKKIDFTLEYIFKSPGKYEFTFRFCELLKNANKLFYNCSTLISLNFSKFKSNYITDMTQMFENCDRIETLDLSNFKTKDVTLMRQTFKGCKLLKNLDLTSFNTNNVIDMSGMLCECNSLTFLNLSNFRTQKVKNMNKMFYKCGSLLYLNLSNFTSESVNNICEMFAECVSLDALEFSKFIINENINKKNMFLNCPYFKELKQNYTNEIKEENIKINLNEQCKETLNNECRIIIRDLIKKQNYENKNVINDILEDFINNINILILENNEGNQYKLIKEITKIKNGKFNEKNNYYEVGLLKFFEIGKINDDNNNIKKILQETENKIIDLNKKDSELIINFIWLFTSCKKLDNTIVNELNKLSNKQENKIPIFIIYLYSNLEEKENLLNFKEYFNENINMIIPIPYDEENKQINVNEIFINLKDYISNILYQKIQENSKGIKLLIKNRIEKIEINNENNINDNNDLGKLILNYIEKLLGKNKEVTKLLPKIINTSLKSCKRNIDTNVMNIYIDEFMKSELNLKVSNDKKVYIENIDDGLNKDIEKKCTNISDEFFEKKYKQEFYNTFKGLLKIEALNIIEKNLKNKDKEELKNLINN